MKKIDHPFVAVPGSRVCGHSIKRIGSTYGVPLAIESVRCAAPEWKHAQPAAGAEPVAPAPAADSR